MNIRPIYKYTIQTIPVGVPYHYPDSTSVMVIMNDTNNERVIVDLTHNMVRTYGKDDNSSCMPIDGNTMIYGN